MGKYMYDFRLRKNFLNKRQKHNFEGKDKYNFTILKKTLLLIQVSEKTNSWIQRTDWLGGG